MRRHNYKLLKRYIVLCWILDGGHYKKLTPIIKSHQVILDEFLTKYWLFYHKLLHYHEASNINMATLLSNEFNDLFSTKTDYEQLNDRIAKTLEKDKTSSKGNHDVLRTDTIRSYSNSFKA